MTRASLSTACLLAASLTLTGCAMAQTGVVDRDEVVLLFPTVGSIDHDHHWSIDIHGWVFEPENRQWLINWLAKQMDLDLDDEDFSVINHRLSILWPNSPRAVVPELVKVSRRLFRYILHASLGGDFWRNQVWSQQCSYEIRFFEAA